MEEEKDGASGHKLKTLPPGISPNNWFLKLYNSDLSRKEKFELWRKRQGEIYVQGRTR
ncbi:MAG: hypothetical protein IMF19_14930 [Proteobacteria bacterium]|nr:hypothetical protein [Pseudomonadota bacterium]